MRLDILLKILDTLEYPADCEVIIDEYNALTVINKDRIVVRLDLVGTIPAPLLAPQSPAPAPEKTLAPVIDSDKFRYSGPGKKGIDWLLGRSEKK